MKLYSYFLSSAAYRVRIALNLKGIGFETVPIDLMRPGGGAQHDEGYGAINAQRMVPALDIGSGSCACGYSGQSTSEAGSDQSGTSQPGTSQSDASQSGASQSGASELGTSPFGASQAGTILTQSVAILEYLEERYPEPPLLPRRPEDRATVRAMMQAVVSDIHPLVTLRVVKQLSSEFGMDQARIDAWLRHWITTGFQALEQMIGDDGHCFGGYTTMADVCLVPQVTTARRYGVPLDAFPKICKVADLCGSLPAFSMAHPARQPDAQEIQ